MKERLKRYLYSAFTFTFPFRCLVLLCREVAEPCLVVSDLPANFSEEDLVHLLGKLSPLCSRIQIDEESHRAVIYLTNPKDSQTLHEFLDGRTCRNQQLTAQIGQSAEFGEIHLNPMFTPFSMLL